MRDFLIKNRKLLNLSEIERELSMPQGYLHKYIELGYLPEDWKLKLKKYLEMVFKEKILK